MKEQDKLLRPDFLFEVGWEICHSGGGIQTALMSKARYLEKQLGVNYILIGPDVSKELNDNTAFTEDQNLFSRWVREANNDGLHFRVGRWNVPGNPVTILVDHSHFFTQKDVIFSGMWETYRLDSISGGWDYTEPALFGYSAAKVIESFYKFHISAYDKMVVHFHDWKSGLGLLTLKKEVPQAALVFTAYDTVAGRTLSAEGHNVFSPPGTDLTNEMIDRTGQRAKFSLEKLCIQNADCFTAVSRIHSDEVAGFYQKDACVITHCGIAEWILPDKEHLDESRKQFRHKLLNFISFFFGMKADEDCLILFHSGRNEFTNKGTDVLIEALASLQTKKLSKQVFAIIATPANHSGPREEVRKRVDEENISGDPVEGEITTHHLLSADKERIINHLKKYNLQNSSDDRVKIIYIPAWLDGNDGIIGLNYYEILMGIDLGIYPAFYEPWGYTPLECLASGNPAMTTSLCGFGQWTKNKFPECEALHILERNETNKNEVINQTVSFIENYLNSDAPTKIKLKEEAQSIAEAAYWEHFIQDYYISYHKALEISSDRIEQYKHKHVIPVISKPAESLPHWYKVLIKPFFPDQLLPLKELSQNLWWSWNYNAQKLFQNINPQLWEKSGHNPIALLELLDIKEVRKLEEDPEFISELKIVYDQFSQYMSAKRADNNTIAYFCMEYGLHESVKLYSGGLGILAGDYLKEASDLNKNFIAVGLLYRYGYFNQKVSSVGDQINEKIPQKFTHLPILPVRDAQQNWVSVQLVFPGRTVTAKVWVLHVGRIPLYLLDTDIDENHDYDRNITHQLYGGDWENRLKQELLLGIGGIRMLKKIGLKPDLYHLNEGHAAFLNLERLRFLIQEEKLSFNQAVEVLRANSLFTTHTPVPAGHDTFDENLLRVYLSHYPNRFNISWEKFMGLGRIHEYDNSEKFSMSILALKLSQECNGVSRLHGMVSREMFSSLYPGYFGEELHISHVTNGVHFSTWAAEDWQNILTQNHKHSLDHCLNNSEQWKHIYDIPDKTIWDIRNKYRAELLEFISEKLVRDYTSRQEQPHILMQTLENIKPDVLTIGFARRFATYKRAHLLFSNPERLSKIVNDSLKPVRFIFAGKAHPNDTQGQELIKKIIAWSKQPEFLGKVIFLENYDAGIARKMVQGVDIWLNTPTRPLEASGTSGEKCVMNGVLHLSVLDGWWAEGYVPKAGWALKEARTYLNQELQNELDAETIYSLLETEIIPLFFKRNQHGVPCEWVQYIKKCLCEIAPVYTMRRMMNDYYHQFYKKMLTRSREISRNNYEKAYTISSWKRKTKLMWDNVKILENRCHDSSVRPLLLGEEFHAEILIDTAGIDAKEIGVEILFGQKNLDKIEKILFREDLLLSEYNENTALYVKDIEIRTAGVLDFAIRIYIHHPDLPHRTDFGLVKWG